jgi:hypothetical protein
MTMATIRKILCYFGKHAGHFYTGGELNLKGRVYRVCAYCGDVENVAYNIMETGSKKHVP